MIDIASPLSGWATPLDKVPDPVFSERMLGDGIAVDPVEGLVVAPGAGVVESIHAAGHAVTVALDSGPVLLIHIGLDTVALGGAGFTKCVAEGQRVAAGDALIRFDLDLLARRARSLVTPVIVTNGEAFRLASAPAEGPVEAGQPLMSIEALAVSEADGEPAEMTVSRSLTLLLAHGLHARPAARLSKLAGEFEATVEILTGDGRSASARSPVQMLGLGLTHGVDFTIRGGGGQAEQAIAALAELLDSGMGELRPLVETAAPLASVETAGELRGIAAVDGLAMGPAWRLKQAEIVVCEQGESRDAERAAFAAARERVRNELESEAGGAGALAGIAAAHLAMLDDPLLDEAAQRLIAAGKSAAFAWREAIAQFAAPLRTSSDPRFAERLDDLVDLERRLLSELTGEAAAPPKPPKGAILVAETLYPSQLTALADCGLAGIATAAGGATSHAAIIAAGLGIPMLVGLGTGLAGVEDGTPLILRGDSLAVAPQKAVLAKAQKNAAAREARRQGARARAQELATTADGVRIEVFANLGSVADAEIAVSEGAEGCGLLRTEFLFLDRASPPGEDEQRAAYQRIADTLGERPLIVRTLDIGADKPVPWLPLEREDNPALGLRGIRLQLARPDLLETQLRALLGVRSRGPLRIMLPMVSALDELRQTKAILDRLASDMDVPAPALGIMVETPAAALMAGTLAADAAFFSIGSNDLSQYVLARDRTNPAVGAGLDALDPAVLRLIDETARGGAMHGRITGVCGGMAALPEALPILLGLGVTELSVPASAIPETKALVRSLDLARCRAAAGHALAASDAAAVRALVRPILEEAA